MTTQRDTTQPAGGSPLERWVMPLAERLERLAAAYSEDYPGHALDAGLMQRVRWWCADKPGPAAVSAAPDGAICVEWRGDGEALVVRYSLSGGAVWAGSIGVSRPYGDGYPLVSAWPCLRHNVVIGGSLTDSAQK